MKVLILGGAGMVGRKLAERLAKDGELGGKAMHVDDRFFDVDHAGFEQTRKSIDREKHTKGGALRFEIPELREERVDVPRPEAIAVNMFSLQAYPVHFAASRIGYHAVPGIEPVANPLTEKCGDIRAAACGDDHNIIFFL